MSSKPLIHKIAELLYDTNVGYTNQQLATKYRVSKDVARGTLTKLRKYGLNVVKRMETRGAPCKYYIVRGIAEDVHTRIGRPPFSFAEK